MISFKLKDSGTTFFFSKEPEKFHSYLKVKFKDGEIAHWSKYIHREDGPAVEHDHGGKNWYWHGEQLYNINSQEEFENWKRFKNFQ